MCRQFRPYSRIVLSRERGVGPIILHPIGIIHSPYKISGEAPRQGRFSEHLMELEIYEEYGDGLKDIEKATHLIVLHWLHLAGRDLLQVRTPHSKKVRGVFACRSPVRPNPIAFNIARLLHRNGNRLSVQGLDALDGSPLLDLKPYSSDLDSIPGVNIGWLKIKKESKRS